MTGHPDWTGICALVILGMLFLLGVVTAVLMVVDWDESEAEGSGDGGDGGDGVV